MLVFSTLVDTLQTGLEKHLSLCHVKTNSHFFFLYFVDFFKRPLENKTIMEGVEVSFECEAEKKYPVSWFKGNEIVNPSSKFKIETHGNTVHKLTIQPTTLEDKGKYCIKMKDISCCAELDVKGNTLHHLIVCLHIHPCFNEVNT